MNIQTIKEFLNIADIPDHLITNAIAEAEQFLKRKNIEIPAPEVRRGRPSRNVENSDILSAWKYLTAYFLLPQLSVIWGSLGITKQIGMGDGSQQLICESDIERKQTFYYNHAMSIINDITTDDVPFAIDI